MPPEREEMANDSREAADTSGADLENPAMAQPFQKDMEEPSTKSTNARKSVFGFVLLLLIICAIVFPILYTKTEVFQGSKSSAELAAGDGTSTTSPVVPLPFAPYTAAPSASDVTDSPVASPVAAPVTGKPSSASPTPAPVAPTLSPSGAPHAPTAAPVTGAPVLPPVQLDSGLLQMLSSSSFTPDAFNDTSSSEYAAAYWLQVNDKALPDNPNAIIQRYAVLVSMISLFQDNTPVFANETESECNWQGVNCTDDIVTKIVWANLSLSGTVPPDLGLLYKVDYLDLGENELSGTVPDAIFEMKNLTELYLHQNRFSGTISDRFSELFWLEKLFLFANNFSGTFPTGLASPGTGSSNSRPLRYLLMANNSFSGPIPENLNWGYMHFFDISHNQMTGSLIPSDWLESDRPVYLRHYYASNNQMTGSLPENFQWLGNGRLFSLIISDNSLTGEFPTNWQETTLLQVLEIQNNNFTKIPDDICQMEVFYEPGQLSTLRADCDICTCEYFCSAEYCTA